MKKPVNSPLYRIYSEDVPELLYELADTPAMQRLKDIGMNCGLEYTSFPLYNALDPYSRFDHSFGVALIIWHFTRDIRQAAAGLFHDISTPVFAHVIDFMNGDHLTQESTEESTAETIRNSGEIMRLLRREGIAAEEVADYHMYPVADNPSGQLSADRLEYTLGNFLNYRFAPLEDCAEYYRNLTVGVNEWGKTELVFGDETTAVRFAHAALKNSVVYSQDPDRYAMEYLARIVRNALDRRVIKYEELWTTESDVIRKLKSDPVSAGEWARYTSFSRILKSPEEKTEEGWINVNAKRRYIDPCVKDKGRCSDLNAGIRKELEDFRKESYDYWLKAE